MSEEGELVESMPYEERFWRSRTLDEVKAFADPVGVQGFICALSTLWTRGENNDSGLNLSILAQLLDSNGRILASVDQDPDKERKNT